MVNNKLFYIWIGFLTIATIINICVSLYIGYEVYELNHRINVIIKDIDGIITSTQAMIHSVNSISSHTHNLLSILH